ncbi:MAG: glycine cleavage system protein T, partial [Planctomycetota bacterium]|nr:glycine cleavage system protein T [Planctomycetota bacterium]
AAAVVGTVTSGSFCPTLGTAAAMALVDREAAATGTRLDLLIRDTPVAAEVTPLPFYKRPAPQP